MPHLVEQCFIVGLEAIALDADKLTAVEKEREVAYLGLTPTEPHRGEVIPAVRVEGALADRGAEDQLHLTFAHARPELIELALVNQVPLEDRRAVDRTGPHQERDDREKATHRQDVLAVNRDRNGTLWMLSDVPRLR